MKQIQKITDAQIASKGVISLSDRPNALQQYGGEGLSPAALKQRFDKLAAFIAERFNEIADDLSGTDAAEYIHIALLDGLLVNSKLERIDEASLNDLVESMLSGAFAADIIKVFPSITAVQAVSLQALINSIAKDISVLQERDGELQGNIDSEKTRAEGAERTLQENINAEKIRAEGAEDTLQKNIDAEKTRAEGAEGTLQGNINAEKNRAEGAERGLNDAISGEAKRASDAEAALGQRITDETANQAKTNQNNNFTTPQTINGDLTVNGNITQNGATYESHAEKVYTKNDKIILREGATGGLGEGEYAGLVAQKYDGEHDGHLVFDAEGVARVGDVGDEQPLATREETVPDGEAVKWDGEKQRLVGSGEKIEDKADKKDLKKVATTGDYNDLKNLPNVPTKYVKSVEQIEKSEENGGNNTLRITNEKDETIDFTARNGTSGVYIGSGDMPENCDLQIDPDGDPFELGDLISAEDKTKIIEAITEDVDADLLYVKKLPYEWKKMFNIVNNGRDLANNGTTTSVIKIASIKHWSSTKEFLFSCDISMTNRSVYHGTLVLTNRTTMVASLYGDPTGVLASRIYIVPKTWSNEVVDGEEVDVFFDVEDYEKIAFHIKSTNDAADVLTAVSAVPSEATVRPTNALTDNLVPKYKNEWKRMFDIGSGNRDYANSNTVTNVIKLASVKKRSAHQFVLAVDIDIVTAANVYHSTLSLGYRGGTKATVYGDPTGFIASKIYIVPRDWANESENIDIYFDVDNYEKSMFHIRSMNECDDVFAIVDSIPEEATMHPTNALSAALGEKVDKVEGKALSANDYTNEDKALLGQVAQVLQNVGCIKEEYYRKNETAVIGKDDFGLYVLISGSSSASYNGAAHTGQVHFFFKAMWGETNRLTHFVFEKGTLLPSFDSIQSNLETDVSVTNTSTEHGMNLIRIPMYSPKTPIEAEAAASESEV